MADLVAPAGLGEAGLRLWLAFTGPLNLDPWEVPIMELACRQADRLAALEAAIDRDGLVTKGSRGQPVLSGAASEARQTSLAIARLLGELRLPPAVVGKPVRSAGSERAARAVNARWDRVRARAEGGVVSGLS